jgi:hypothetical protein
MLTVWYDCMIYRKTACLMSHTSQIEHTSLPLDIYSSCCARAYNALKIIQITRPCS